MIVDTEGIPFAIKVHEGNIQDRDGAEFVLKEARDYSNRLELVWADGGYRGKLIEKTKKKFDIKLEIVKRDEKQKGFVLLAKRWIVERTFAWIGRFRRMSKDYEYLMETSEAMIMLTFIWILSRRLAQ